MLPDRVRTYIYTLGTPAFALLVFYGLLTEQAASLWLGLLGAVLQVGEGTVAAINRPTKGKRNGSNTGHKPSERGL